LPCQESNQNSSGFLPTPRCDADSHIAFTFSPKKELNKQENASIESPSTLEEKRKTNKHRFKQTPLSVELHFAILLRNVNGTVLFSPFRFLRVEE
jgi:hypothetical protein